MPYPPFLVAGSNGEMLEVEQVDLFKHLIGEMEFNLAVHIEPEKLGSAEKRSLAVSLYETGCKLASLPAGDDAMVLHGRGDELEIGSIRLRALTTVDDLIAELGSSRLSALLSLSLSQRVHYNA